MATTATITETVHLKHRPARSEAADVTEATANAHEAMDSGSRSSSKIVWANVVKFAVLHAVGLWALYCLPEVTLKTAAFGVVTFFISAMGVTAGAHRLWTHRSYKARFPLRVFLMLANCMSAQNSIYVWSRDHRAHHKFSETDADPHNANRGFFFAHMGWLLVRKHPEVLRKGSKIDLSDLEADSVVMMQHRNYIPMSVLVSFVLPTLVPWYFWGESLKVAYLVAVLRYLIVLHNTWLVNSAAHLWGHRPYDVHINPAENLVVSLLATGEGFHNYHHTFPHDYSTSEWRYSFNATTLFIDAMALLGLAYDRRSVAKDTVEKRSQRTGPGSSAAAAVGIEKDY